MAIELTFFTNPNSRGQIVRWMLEEIGMPYTTKILEYGPEMKSPEYLSINPMGKVPAIKHKDTVVTETSAICSYLADVFPSAGLAPELDNRGEYYRWLHFAAGPIEAAFTNKALELKIPSDKEAIIGYGNYELVISTLEKVFSKGGYIADNKFTAADIVVGSHIGWNMEFGNIEKLPVFEDYWSFVSDREAYRRAKQIDESLIDSSKE